MHRLQARTVALIGAGKVGTVLTATLARAGYSVAGIWDVSPAAVAASERVLGPVSSSASTREAVARAAIVLIAVPDDTLSSVAEQLAAYNVDWRDRVVAHTSGRYGAGVLDPLRQRAASTVAIHPGMAFSGDSSADLARVAGTCFAVTGSSIAAEDAGWAIVRDLGGTAFRVAEADRPLYHAALAHGSNHLVTLVIQAVQMLKVAGVQSPADVLRPLLQAALDNSLRLGAAGATGPVVRGDSGTVREHVATLTHRLPEVLSTYKALTTAGIAIAHDAGRITPQQQHQLTQALSD